MSFGGRFAIGHRKPWPISTLFGSTIFESPGGSTAERLVREIGRAILVIEDINVLGGQETSCGQEFARSRSPQTSFSIAWDNVPQIVRVLDGRRDIDSIFSE